jgi:flagellar hook-length control protein FliK
MPAEPAPAPADARSQPPAQPGFDHALAHAHDKVSARSKANTNAKPRPKPTSETRAKEPDTPKAEADADTATPKDVTALGDATGAALVAALSSAGAPATATPATDATATTENAPDATATQPGITNVFAAAVAALTDTTDQATATPSEPASENRTTSGSGTQVDGKGAERKNFVQTIPGAATGMDKGRAIDVPPMQQQGGDANANPDGTSHPFARSTVPAATNAAATAVAHAADPSPVHGTAPAALTRNDAPHASTAAVSPVVATAPVTATTHVDAAAPTVEPTPAAPAAPPPPAEQLLAVMRPLQRTADGSYRIRIEMRPPELGRVDMRIEVKDGVVHASIHAEHAETADLVRNALDDLRARLDADGVRAGSLEVNDGRANDARREQRREHDAADEPEIVGGAMATPIRTNHQSDALLDVRI